MGEAYRKIKLKWENSSVQKLNKTKGLSLPEEEVVGGVLEQELVEELTVQLHLHRLVRKSES